MSGSDVVGDGLLDCLGGSRIFGTSLSIVSVGRPDGGGRKKPRRARAGSRARALKPFSQEEGLGLAGSGAGQSWHTAVVSSGLQYHTGRTTWY